MKAVSQGNEIIITAADDGRGIDIEKIRLKGEKMGLQREKLKRMTEEELIKLIFTPGFTTASQVTSLAGRGVGLDVVREAVEAMGGRVEVKTELNVGTRFTPLSVSVMRVLLVGVRGFLLAFATNSIGEVKLFFPDIGNKIKLVFLSDWLQFHYASPIREKMPRVWMPLVVITGENGNEVGFVVDSYWGKKRQ
ncbi:MAG: ATP-binding protein [Geminocystis sp.]|nr:ATP-binding protein [Geminocystis sp.]MCS7147965.1 ATP-binding protein [Geminocystis sp.]MCX8078939.1 ATP-binding protein [Geminocystis sp.]MDW8462511.1 ATP-binding protein [Geminocystis sp.]